jgi:hypothetical protein
MKIRHGVAKMATLSIVIALSLLGLSTVASAKNVKGSAKWCAQHPKAAKKTAACSTTTGGGGSGSTGGGGTGSGGTTGGSNALTVQIDPNPLVETGPSGIVAVIQIETSPSFAGDPVNIDSSQLSASCAMADFGNLQVSHVNNITAVLDDDGNAAVIFEGMGCAPGSSVVEADLEVAPFTTGLGTLKALPPAVTAPGVTGYPSTSGSVTTGEVETGDTAASGDSDIYAVFYVETDPVYAEQTVSISSAQLEARCITGWQWGALSGPNRIGVGVNTGAPKTAVLDDDGNAVFFFAGSSCASGPSTVIAEVLSGFNATYTGSFTVNPPQPTI